MANVAATVPASVQEKESHTSSGLGSLLISLLKDHIGRVTVSCLLAVLAGISELSAYWIFYLLAEALIAPDVDPGHMIFICVLLPGFVVVRLLFLGGASVLSHSVGFAAARHLRDRMVKQVTAWCLGQTEGQTTKIKKTIVDYPSEVEHVIAHTLPDVVSGLATMVFAFLLLAYVDWRLALVALAPIPVAIGAQMWAFRIFGTMTKDWFAADRQVAAALLSYVRGIVTLKAFNRTASSLSGLRTATDTLLSLSSGAMRSSALPFAIFFTAVSGNLVFICPAALYFYGAGEIGLPELVLFVTLGAQTTAPLLKLLFANGAMQRLTVAGKRIAEVIESPTVAPPVVPRRPDATDIGFEQVSFGYQENRDVLHRVDLTLREGQVSALVGPSGAGKTTLIRLAARFWDARTGVVRIGGVDVRDIAPDHLRRLISIVFQDPYFFNGTIRENLSIAAPFQPDEKLQAAIEAAQLANLVTQMPQGLDTTIGERGIRLSSGERQRLAIARALLKDAPILLLDEATAFADPENELFVQRAISRLAAGRTVLVVAHRLAMVQSADLTAVLNEGRIEASGTHDTLLKRSSTYSSLWSAQERAMRWSISRRLTSEGHTSC